MIAWINLITRQACNRRIKKKVSAFSLQKRPTKPTEEREGERGKVPFYLETMFFQSSNSFETNICKLHVKAKPSQTPTPPPIPCFTFQVLSSSSSSSSALKESLKLFIYSFLFCSFQTSLLENEKKPVKQTKLLISPMSLSS